MLASAIQKQKPKRPLRVLLDTGADRTMIYRGSLPKGAVPITTESLPLVGLGGRQCTNQQVLLDKV